MRASDPGAGRRCGAGFTLVELLVVIAIIAVLAGLLFPAVVYARKIAKQRAARNQLSAIVMAVDKYRDEYRHYPPDGGTSGDSAKYTDADEATRGSKNLYHYLCQSFEVKEKNADGTPAAETARRIGPFLTLPEARVVQLDGVRALVSPMREDVSRGSYVYRRLADQAATATSTRPEFFVIVDVGPDGEAGQCFRSNDSTAYPDYSVIELDPANLEGTEDNVYSTEIKSK